MRNTKRVVNLEGVCVRCDNDIVSDLGHGVWQLTSGQGWRFKSLTLDECKEACISLGDCAELVVSSNGFCYPAQSGCDGDQMTGAAKYWLGICPQPPASPPVHDRS